MPVIPTVGRKSPGIRALIIAIYVILTLGAITMVYPFWIVLAGSVASHEAYDYPLFPRYLYSETGLFQTHLWKKVYLYSGIEDISWQWKITVPGVYGRDTNRWRMIPGADEPPTGSSMLAKALRAQACQEPFDPFKREWAAIGSPTQWNGKLEKIVRETYPFAADAMRQLAESGDFRMDRKPVLAALDKAYNARLDRFYADYEGLGLPDYRSAQFADLLKKYPDLTKLPAFVPVIQDYWIGRKPDLKDPKILRQIEDYKEFKLTLPNSYRECYWVSPWGRILKGSRMYRDHLKEKYHGDMAAIRDAYNLQVDNFQDINPQWDPPTGRGRYAEDSPPNRDWAEWKATRSVEWIRPRVSEYWWSDSLSKKYDNDITKLNAAYGTDYKRFFDVPLAEYAPTNPAARKDWEDYFRNQMATQFLRFTGGEDLWQQFLLGKFGSVAAINKALQRSYASAADIRLPYINETTVMHPANPYKFLGYPPTRQENDLLLEFVAKKMPVEYVRVATSENLYRNFLMKKYGSVENVNAAYGTIARDKTDLYFPMAAVEWQETGQNAAAERWDTFSRSYKNAIDTLVRQKRSMFNTAVYCTAVVLLSLIINPLCAYALSRFNLPGSYNILLFLLATMAFPAEVTMIPNFLLLKSFPLVSVVCTLAGLVVGAALGQWFLKEKKFSYTLLASLIGGILGLTLISEIVRQSMGISGNVSLLNTYWALLLPGVASGYSVFILKGFFDSLPQELYEASVIDGASEMRIFWQITIPMSKPVLAVISLWAFTAAYGSFMWAMIICQDPKMWTIMVHVYQLQLFASDTCDYFAVLVLASLPTLIVFIAAQRAILKGIILPSYK